MDSQICFFNEIRDGWKMRSGMKRSPENTPRYQIIKNFIREGIANRTYKTGDRIPTEHQLATRFNVSRMTANRAVRELVSEGMLVRQQGLGTFVVPIQAESPLLEVRNIADEIRGRHNIYSNECHRLQEVSAGKDLADQLGVAVGSPVYYSLIVHKENGQPLQFAERYVNAELVPDYIKQDFSATTPNQYLCKLFPLSEIEHTVEAVLPTPSEQEALNISAETPCLLVKRRTWSGNNLISYARLVHPGNLYRLSSRSEI